MNRGALVLIRVVLLCCAQLLLLTELVRAADFVGAAKCASCHSTQFGQWHLSDHAKSMGEANSENVLGNFAKQKVTFHNMESHFYTKQVDGGVEYFVNTIDSSGKAKEFQIKYTFGHFPLQQYLIELEGGHIQALNIAWDSRDKKTGGQRWFHLQPDEEITTEHPFFWPRHFQNWNNRCASCHSTNLEKNYNAADHSYDTRFSEINVACESCHGPASTHREMAAKGKLSKKNSGFDRALPNKNKWQFSEGEAIATAIGKKDRAEIDMCGRCHSLRVPLKKHHATHSFLDTNDLHSIASPFYFPDGQIREEVFVLGSFMQSKMFHRGVTCSNCHNPHSGDILVAGNALCAQCHSTKVYDTPAHHHHPEASSGAQCVNCHMPERTYMGVDNRRDHSFTIPRPQLSFDLGVPNACVGCHQGKDNAWALENLGKWGVQEQGEAHWAYAHQKAESGDVLASRQVIAHAADESLPEYIRASLLRDLAFMPSRISVEFAQKQLRSASPLMRQAAISSLQSLPPQTRWKMLSLHLDDPSPLVRFQLTQALAELVSTLPENDSRKIEKLIEEYRRVMALSADSPATRLNLANLEMQLGNVDAAENEFKQAMRIESNYVPAIINLADFYRGSGKDAKVEPLLKRALAIAPDSGAANHSYGLFLVRQKKYNESLAYLKRATEPEDATPRFSFVYAIALDNQGKTALAVSTLEKANKQWQHQYDLLMLQIRFLEKLGRSDQVLPYLSKLSAIAPGSPDVKAMINKYAR
ncbi:MAG: hypothetical protein KJO62_11955 [Gammaproteobacteria bacterium]|nr:hypothetical protein [Gammaproteobacteria bacterium]